MLGATREEILSSAEPIKTGYARGLRFSILRARVLNIGGASEPELDKAISIKSP